MRPAVDCDAAIARVDSHDNLSRMFGGEGYNERLVAHRRGTKHDARDTERAIRVERCTRAHAASNLHSRAEGLDDGTDERLLYGVAGARAFEIDDVKPRDLASPECCAGRRIAIVNRDGVVSPLSKAHDLACEEVDGRDDDHEATNLSSSAKPAR